MLATTEWIGLIGIAVTVCIALGSLQWAMADRARSSRIAMHNKIDALHIALDNFRVETSAKLGKLDGRLTAIEGRSHNTRVGDARSNG